MEKMVIGVTSDWHLDAQTAGEPRYKEIEEFAVMWSAKLQSIDADLMLHLGDLFDPGRDDLLWSSRMIALARMMNTSVRSSLWLSGNHDVVDRDHVVTSLSPLREATELSNCNAIVAETPGLYEFRNGGLHVVVLALPYPSRSDVEWWEEQVEHAIGLIPEDSAVVVASHLCLEGASVGSESREMARGTNVFLMPEWLDRVQPRIVVNGHYHRRQVVECGDWSVHVPGSPVRLTFAEEDDEHKGGLIIELTPESE